MTTRLGPQLAIDPSLDGFEALSVSERIKIFFSEISVGIDKLNANIFNGSIHTVNYEGILKILKKQNDYFSFSSNQIPTPVFFNPKKGSFRSYVSFCISAVGLLDLAETEVNRLYDHFKTIVKTGTVPFAIRNWDHQKALEEAKQNMDHWFVNERKTTQTLNEVHNSITEAEDTFKYYNGVVKNLKSRDGEILNKKIELLTDIFKLIKKKIDVGDLKFDNDDTITMEVCIGRLNEIVSTTGLHLARLNELCRVLELQVEEFKRYVK